MMDDQISDNLSKISTWKRIVFMLVYAVIDSIVKLLIWAVVFLQVASLLLTGAVNSNILGFGRSLSTYHYHLLLFLTFNTEQLPFPFSDWNTTTALEAPDHK